MRGGKRVVAASVPALAESDEAPPVGFTMASPVSIAYLAEHQETLPMPPSLPDRQARGENHVRLSPPLALDELTRRRRDVDSRQSSQLPQATLGRLLEDTVRDRENPSRGMDVPTRQELENR